jgi:hypothetical protein
VCSVGFTGKRIRRPGLPGLTSHGLRPHPTPCRSWRSSGTYPSILDEHLSMTLSMKPCRWCAAQPRQPLPTTALTCQFTPTGSPPPSFNPRVVGSIPTGPTKADQQRWPIL